MTRGHLFLCDADWETALLSELATEFPTAAFVSSAPGWVWSNRPIDVAPLPPSVAFASQCLPDAQAMQAESVKTWARSLADTIITSLPDNDAPWRLHRFARYAEGKSAGRRRCLLIAEELEAILKKRNRRLLARLVPQSDAPWQPQESLVQLGLTSPSSGYISVCDPTTRHWLRRCLSRFPGGCLEVANDRTAPSRAFAKLAEAELRMARPIAAGETCVDLGSSPGSWAWLALKRGAQVTAVDRSPLRDDLMRHPRLVFQRGDAFKFRPAQPVDWLLCDVIAFPARINALLAEWLMRRLCRCFCVTIKFKGSADYAQLAETKAVLNASGAEFQLRRLNANRNEVTAFGAIAPGDCRLEPGHSL